MNTEQEILEIKQRNKRVEMDKQWEQSWIRKFTIIILTYIIAAVWLIVIHEPHLWWKAAIPAVGYLLSTLSLSSIKRWWVEKEN